MLKIIRYILILSLFPLILSACGSDTSNYSLEDEETNTITADEAIQNNWDSIKDYLSGSESVEACTDSGCYTLDADISNGQITQITFPNEGYLYFSADIDENGNASDSDNDGRNWDFTLDMGSTTVQNAVQEWANSNNYELN